MFSGFDFDVIQRSAPYLFREGMTFTLTLTAMAMTGGSTTTAGAPRPIVKSDKENIGRNDPCWCGSGKKFKKCHGA